MCLRDNRAAVIRASLACVDGNTEGPISLSKRHIATLDGLRGVAALAVVCRHMTSQTVHGALPFRAQLAVDFFFVLSGFVIAGAYERRLLDNMSFWSFARVRLIRLYPLIVLGIVIGAVSKMGAYLHFSSAITAGHGPLIILSAVVLGLLLLPYSGMYGVGGDIFPLDVPIWSLMFEFWANALYARFVRLLTTPVLIGVVALGAVALAVAALFNGGLNGGNTLVTFYVGVARVWFSFFTGILIFRLLTPRRAAKIPRVAAPVLAIVLVLSFLPGPAAWGWVYELAMVLGVYPAIVLLGTTDMISARWRPIALFAGALSYPIYVLHYPTFTHFSHFKELHGPKLIAMLAAAFLGAIVISYLAMRFYDEPVRAWLTKRFKAPRSHVPVVSGDREAGRPVSAESPTLKTLR